MANRNGISKNRFTGWVDVPLSPKGEQEAKNAGEKLKDYNSTARSRQS